MKSKKYLILCAVCIAFTTFAQQFAGSTNQTGAIYRAGSIGVGVTSVPNGVDLMVNNTTNQSGKFVLGSNALYGAYSNPESVLQVYSSGSNRSRINLTSASSATNTISMSLDASLTGTAVGISMVATTSGNKKPFVIDMYGTNSMVISTTGQVGIGTGSTTLGTMKLAVNGTIGAREVKVTLSNPWPDYVFKSDYKRKSFDELAEYINVEKHLPYISSANQIEKDGYQSIGETQQSMLQSLEELYLYVLDLKAENKALNEKIEKLMKNK